MSSHQGHRAVALAALAGVCGILGATWWQAGKADRSLFTRLQERVAPGPSAPQACRHPERRQLVILALGQSNAGNHGAETDPEPRDEAPTVTVFDGTACRRSADPLPGGTGRHRSIWSRLEDQFKRRGTPVEVVVALLAVDSTSIDDWTRSGSPLAEELSRLLSALSRHPLRPDVVLWQQGESDARQGTSSSDYEARFDRLLTQLRHAGIDAPVLLARSTRCRNQGPRAVHQAQDRLVQRHAGVLMGPDIDALAGPLRHLDCHLTAAGLDAAASAWVEAIEPARRRR